MRDLPGTGGANLFPGRHIFRIDEKIIPGVCIRDLSESFCRVSHPNLLIHSTKCCTSMNR